MTCKRVNELSLEKLRNLVNKFVSRERNVVFDLLVEMETPRPSRENGGFCCGVFAENVEIWIHWLKMFVAG